MTINAKLSTFAGLPIVAWNSDETPADPASVAWRLELEEFDADPAEFERLVHPDARFVERPCLVSPRGQERDPAGAWAGLVHGRELLRAQRIEVRDHPWPATAS